MRSPPEWAQWVSIHAPAWGATHRGRILRRAKESFNPRARVGRDPKKLTVRDVASNMFQSTRPRGARQREARDQLRQLRVSIHAPAWGATQAFRVFALCH